MANENMKNPFRLLLNVLHRLLDDKADTEYVDRKIDEVCKDVSLGVSEAVVGQTVKITEVDEDGKPTKWEAVEMASGGASSWNDLTDKPFGEEGENNYLVEPFDLPIVYGSVEYYDQITVNSADFTVGSTLYVLWDGAIYEQTVKEHRYTLEPYIGDGHYGEDNGEPFIIYCEDGGNLRIQCNNYTYTGTFSFAVAKTLATIKTLDPKYLPMEEIERIAKENSATPDWEVNDETESGYIKNRPFYTSVEGVYLIEPITLTFNAGESAPNETISEVSLPTGDSEFEVQWNNNTYVCAFGWDRWGEIWDFYCVDGDCPFTLSTNGAVRRKDTEIGELVTFAIGNPLPKYEPLPEKYLPRLSGATDETAGTHGIVPAPPAGGQDYVLLGSGQWGVGLNTIIKQVEGSFTPYNAEEGWYFVRGTIYHNQGSTQTVDNWILIYVSETVGNSKFVYYYGEFLGIYNPVFKYTWDLSVWRVKCVSDEQKYLILQSSSGKKFEITVDDTGALSATEITW